MAIGSNIPREIQDFIHQFIPTVVQMEVLLLLAANPDRNWGTGEVNDELRSEHTLIAQALNSLHESGLLAVRSSASTKCFQYAPDNDVLHRQIDTLAKLYRERRHTIVALIYERPEPGTKSKSDAKTDLKTDALRAFSNAFKLRNEED